MNKQLLTLVILVFGLAITSCSNASKKNISKEDTAAIKTEDSIIKELANASKLIARYESRGVKFTEEQKGQVSKIVAEYNSKGQSNGDRKEITRMIRNNISENVLTEEQRKLMQNKKRKN